MKRRSANQGSAVFAVLIGVIMFGALTYTLAKLWRGGPTDMAEKEQARLYAEEIIGFANGLRIPIDRMTYLGGATDTNIWFAATGANAGYGVVGAHTATEVFHPSGGGATYQKPTASACVSTCAYEFTGQYTVTDIGSSAPELSMLVIDVKKAVCEKINTILNPSWTSIPTEDTLATFAPFDGSTYGAATAITMTGASNEFVGKKNFCYQESGGAERYIFLHVLRVR